jgi:hypothetical protein
MERLEQRLDISMPLPRVLSCARQRPLRLR